MGPGPTKKKTAETFRSVRPMLRELVRPRRGKIALGILLMLVNIGMSMVLPCAPKFLVDNVINKKQYRMLKPLVAVVLGATMIQGSLRFPLTQLLSKEAQRLIAELRRKVQEHVGRLPVAYYDANKTGALVSRIMSDVEGVRNLIGTGLVDFVGGILTALFSLVVLLRISAADDRAGAAVHRGFRAGAAQGVQPHPADLPRARQDQRRSAPGRLTESLGGVRVVKGYHAEARGGAGVFAAACERLLDNVHPQPHRRSR